ncbi:lipopolysaccharide assembly LapA domain-containing protein [Thermodesulfobacteriota bacterium]
MGSYIKGIFFIIVLLFFITFGVKNSQPVQINHYLEVLNINLPLYGAIYIAILVGILIGVAMGLQNWIDLRKKIRSLERENRELEDKLGKEKEESSAEN